jgi:transposase
VFYVGIDLAKFKHSAAVVRDDGRRLLRGFDFPNRRDGFEALAARLEAVGAAAAESKVCLEATGHYGRNLIAFLEGRGYEVFEVNPLLTANWRRATSVRKVKNDAVDAEALALWLLAGNPTARRRAKDESDDLRSSVSDFERLRAVGFPARSHSASASASTASFFTFLTLMALRQLDVSSGFTSKTS